MNRNTIETAAILIGGEGTRLRPLTICKPKALVPVANKPLLTHILTWLKKYGIKEVIFILYYQKEKLKKVFGDGSKFGLTIKYVEEDLPRGTGGALKKASYLIKDTIVVINGDILTDINILQVANFHKEKKACFTITLIPVEDPTAYGLVKTDNKGKIIQFLEKPSWEEISQEKNINAGIYIIEPHIIKKIPDNKIYSLERELFPRLISERFYGYKVLDNKSSKKIYWIDIGTPDKYRQANHNILEGKFKVDIKYKELKKRICTEDTKNISKKSILRPNIIIGNNCIIEDNAEIEEFTIIGNNCKIAKNVYIERSILWDNIVVEESVKLVDCIIADNCKIGKFSKISKKTVLGDSTVISPYSIL